YISDPEHTLHDDVVVRTEHRIAVNVQEGTEYANELHAGLFRDRDSHDWFMQPIGIPAACAPVPLWWNLFEVENTVPLLTQETLFDTDFADKTYVTPDNIHLHRYHFVPSQGPFQFAPVTEAPGSFNGTFHLHWRWGKLFKGFGGGRNLLPPNQTW